MNLPEFQLSPQQTAALNRHRKLLCEWNERMNLTSVADQEELSRFHYAESLALGLALPAQPLSIADVGSGAGFPGIPVAVIRPDCRLTLIESNNRKAVFLKEASRGLPNVEVLAVRAESVHSNYDYVISRAVRPASVLNLTISGHFALLLSEAELASLHHQVTVTKLSSGRDRVIAMFHVEHGRIDETSG